ncbi:hypothetical protein LTR09_004570 [Extremus antarcticus]|uniref:Nineteen complex-related protein 2-domain-containing protein n=1 Tax=Extremus antarcticus TaxID=702011 RepID=A0AAJ0DPE8_9PEZI|nr:hypothetical protein LTR09_004570 [Extremus antarcticus]
MKKASRRVPRKIGPTVVGEESEPEDVGVVAPKKSKVSRIAIQKASKRPGVATSKLPSRDTDEDNEGLSYSAVPQGFSIEASHPDVEDVSNETQALDLSSKFGSSLARYQQSAAIPSATEIAEKKARRARLAKEETADEYISLNPSDPELDEDQDENVMRDDIGRLVLKPKDKYQQAESRLVRDDEDVMENFDEFTEADGKIMLGRKAEAAAARKRKETMAAQIAEAEGASDSESNASERERNEAFEAAQTRHGTYGALETTDSNADARPKTPPIITPLPTLDGVIERLRGQVVELQTSRMQKMQEMEALQREKVRLGEEEVRIQKALRETAEKFAALRTEKDIAAPSVTESTPALLDMPSAAGLILDDYENVTASDNELPNLGRQGLGFGPAGRGLESLGTSAESTPMQEDGVEGSGEHGEHPNAMETT